MISAVIELKWGEIRQNVLTWWNQRRSNRLIKVDSTRERSISILQNRYGYTREEAMYQFDKYYSKAWLG